MNAITLALYVGFAAFTAFPYKSMIVSTGSTLAMRTLIAILIYVLFVGASYYIIRKHMGRSGPREALKKVILGVLNIGMLLTLGLVSFGVHNLVSIPPILLTIFGSSNYFFWWFIAPLVALLLI